MLIYYIAVRYPSLVREILSWNYHPYPGWMGALRVVPLLYFLLEV